MSEPKKLIEVAMPIKEISAESVRDKTIRSGHIQTLHKWWARRPLPACSAVVFCSLVDDPLDPKCNKSFIEAADIILKKPEAGIDYYKPYIDIPYTSNIDLMEDNLRNRLLMFVSKFSENTIKGLINSKAIIPNEILSSKSLIKWENKTDNDLLKNARRLIWACYNSKSGLSGNDLINEHDAFFEKIKVAEQNYYNSVNRITDENIKLKDNLDKSINSYLAKMPLVFDPFAGGGAIPLEASRLGCRTHGNDINPVAHIIQLGGTYFPQKFGKKAVFTTQKYKELYANNEFIKNNLFEDNKETISIDNILKHDVEYYANEVLKLLEEKVGQYYPKNKDNQYPVAYYRVKIATCNNPSCKAEVPILRNFYVCNKGEKKIFLKPIINGKEINFSLEKGEHNISPWSNRGNVTCPICNNITENKLVKEQSRNGGLRTRLLAIIYETQNGKEYQLPDHLNIEVLNKIPILDRSSEKMQKNSAGGDTLSWGIDQWSKMFNNRQYYTLEKMVESVIEISSKINIYDLEYKKAIVTYLGIWIDRVSLVSTEFGVYNTLQEIFSPVFGRQAIAMVFDYPESCPFTNVGGVSFKNQLDLILNVIEVEGKSQFYTQCNHTSSGEKYQFKAKEIDATVTDPPYYDAIAYADLSDFFYVWLKKSLSEHYPYNFTTYQTPKDDECTALKHHHDGNEGKAKEHFQNKLTQIFKSIEYQTNGVVSIMFAHQSTEAWSTLCNSILNSSLNITGSWAIDTEVNYAMKAEKSYLSSSVTVSARPSIKLGIGNYKNVKEDVGLKVAEKVNELYTLGFRGSDLLTACFGQAVSEFGKYIKVEKADGSDVTIKELLEMAKEAAFNALLKGFQGDDFTKFYIGWLQLNGFLETEFDDAAKFTKVGLNINVQDLFKEYILIKNGNKQSLGRMRERNSQNVRLGDGTNNSIIDVAHKTMMLYSSPNRNKLIKYIEFNAIDPDNSMWRVLTSLVELLPKDIEDHKLAVGLLTNKDQLIREAKSSNTPKPEQSKLTFE